MVQNIVGKKVYTGKSIQFRTAHYLQADLEISKSIIKTYRHFGDKNLQNISFWKTYQVQTTLCAG